MMSEEQLLEYLLERFPDEKITNASSLEKYSEINHIASTYGISVNEYLKDLGFTLNRKGSLSESETLEMLLTTFPDRRVFSLQNHSTLNNALQRMAREKELTLADYLNEKGFQLIRKPKSNQAIPIESAMVEKEKYIGRTKYDEILMKELIDDYKFIAADFSELLGVSRQAVASKMQRVKRSAFDWSVEKLPEEHMQVVNKMLDDEIAKFENDTHCYYISFNSAKNIFAVTVFPFDTSDFPMCLKGENMDESIKSVLFEKDYHIFSIKDLATLYEIRNSPQEEYDTTSGRFYNLYRLLANKHMDYHAYNDTPTSEDIYEDFTNRYVSFAKLKNLPYKTEDSRKISNDEIRSILQGYYNPISKTVKIPIKDSQYQRFVQLAANRGYNLKDFIELHGFKYKRYREGLDGEKRKKKILERLEQYKVTEDTVYITSYSKFYAHLTNAGRKNGMNLTEYLLSEFQLKRMEYRDLPSGFVPYEFGDSEEDLTKEENYLQYIETNLMIDDEISSFYIDSGSQFYLVLLKYCNMVGITVDEFFKKWELKRLNYREALEELKKLGFTLEEAESFLNRINLEFREVEDNEEVAATSDSSDYPTEEADTAGEVNSKFEKELDSNDENNTEESTTSSEEENPAAVHEENEVIDEEGKKGEGEGESETDSDQRGEDEREPELDSDQTNEDEPEPEPEYEQTDEPEPDTDQTEEPETDSDQPLDNEDILKTLEELSSQVKDTTVEQTKKSRSQKLVRLMKELYENKCQLCNPENPIPVITMFNGMEYVEMHHIIPISTSNAEDETDFILDDYKNAVIVCSHHHKVLHYQQGGFTELDEMIDGLYFVNDEAEIKIYLNKHLEI